MKNAGRSNRKGFTLVELLVVIGIIAILISVLLPVLGNARKAGYKTKCLSNLKTLGDAYKLYQIDNKGYWPAAWQQFKQYGPPFSSSGYGDKRWHDYIGKYVVGRMIGNQELNFNGTQNTDPGKVEPQIWTEPIWHSDNAIWGCPMWDRVARDASGNVVAVDQGGELFPGYQQSWFPQAPNDNNGAIKCIRLDTGKPPGGFFKYTQWTRQSERILLFESIVSHNWGAGMTWPYKADGSDFPKTPSGGVSNFPIDFNRHGRYKSGNKPNDPSLNVLFCDGHAALVSCREAWRAIRFN